MKKCPECGHLNLDSARFCENCGFNLSNISKTESSGSVFEGQIDIDDIKDKLDKDGVYSETKTGKTEDGYSYVEKIEYKKTGDLSDQDLNKLNELIDKVKQTGTIDKEEFKKLSSLSTSEKKDTIKKEVEFYKRLSKERLSDKKRKEYLEYYKDKNKKEHSLTPKRRKKEFDFASIIVNFVFFSIFLIAFWSIFSDIFKDIANDFFNPTEKYIRKADNFYRKHDYNAALKYYKLALKKVKDKRDKIWVLNSIGNCYYYKENYFEAIKYYHKVRHLNKKAYYAYYNLYLCYRQLQRMYKSEDYDYHAFNYAQDLYDVVINIRDSNKRNKLIKRYAKVWKYIGDYYIKNESFLDVYKRVYKFYNLAFKGLKDINIKNRLFLDYINYMIAYKYYKEAENMIKETYLSSSDKLVYSAGCYYYSLINYYQGDYNTSIRYIREGIGYIPKDYKFKSPDLLVHLYGLLGDVFLAKKKYMQARDYYKEYLDLLRKGRYPVRNLAIAYNCIGLTYYYKDRFKLAEKEYLSALKLEKNNKEAIYNLFLVYYYMKDYKKAYKYAIEAKKYYPNDKFLNDFLKNYKGKK